MNPKFTIPPSMRTATQTLELPLEVERRLVRIETRLCRLMAHFGLSRDGDQNDAPYPSSLTRK